MYEILEILAVIDLANVKIYKLLSNSCHVYKVLTPNGASKYYVITLNWMADTDFVLVYMFVETEHACNSMFVWRCLYQLTNIDRCF